MSTTDKLAEMKARALDGVRYAIAHIDDDEDEAEDLGFVYGYHMGALVTLRDLGAMDDDEYNDLIGALLEAVDAEREARGEA